MLPLTGIIFLTLSTHAPLSGRLKLLPISSVHKLAPASASIKSFLKNCTLNATDPTVFAAGWTSFFVTGSTLMLLLSSLALKMLKLKKLFSSPTLESRAVLPGITIFSIPPTLVETIGLPECAINLAHGTVYLCQCLKNKSAYNAYFEAVEDVKKYGNLPVPMSVRNAPTKLMRELGYHQGYKAYTKESLLPEKIKHKKYFKNITVKGSGYKETETEDLPKVKSKSSRKK